jgi:glycosyltransferase involved in cell wall biosynthesis
MGGSGVQRAAKLATYLPLNGWRTHVLCAGHGHYPLTDETLVEGIPDGQVHRVAGNDPAGIAVRLSRHNRFLAANQDRLYWRLEKLFACVPAPESEWLWTGAAVRAAREIIKKNDIDAIITTSPPHSVHAIGRRLKKLLGIPWIADFRDPLLDNFGYAPRRPWIDRYWHKLEAQVVHEVDAIVVTCEDLRQRLMNVYGLDSKRIVVIHNGYDVADAMPASSTHERRTFRISHIGSFYGHQSIAPFLHAMREMVRPQSDAFTFRQVGAISAQERKSVLRSDRCFFEETGYLPHRDAIREMVAADVLLLTTPAQEGARFCIPAKTFEYLAFGGHIVAVIHPGTELSAILRRAGNVTIVEDHSVPAIRVALEKCHASWVRGDLQSSRDMDFVSSFRRDDQARRFAEVLNACSEPAVAGNPDHSIPRSFTPSLQGVA